MEKNSQDLVDSYSFTLPGPPTDNQLYFSPKFRVSGRLRVPTNEHKAWRIEAEWLLKDQIKIKKPYDKRSKWKLICKVNSPKNRMWKYDLTNRFKLLIDCLSRHIAIDDRYITSVIMEKKENENKEYIEETISGILQICR